MCFCLFACANISNGSEMCACESCMCVIHLGLFSVLIIGGSFHPFESSGAEMITAQKPAMAVNNI